MLGWHCGERSDGDGEVTIEEFLAHFDEKLQFHGDAWMRNQSYCDNASICNH